MVRFLLLSIFSLLSYSVSLHALQTPQAVPQQQQPKIVQTASSTAANAVPWANKFFQKENTPALINHDFGTVPSGTLLTHTFTITNIYDVPMQVVYVRKSCNCLEAFPPTNAIQPNETAEFKITMDTTKFKGVNTQTFNVTFGPNFVSTAIVQVKAVSRADVQMSPGSVNFGTIAQGNTPSQVVSLKYLGRQRDWKITEIGAINGPFEATIEEGNQYFTNDFKINIALKKDAPAGQQSGTIQLKTNDSGSPVLPITVSANIQAPLTISPNKANFGKVIVGQTATQRVMIRSAKPFKVEPFKDEAIGVVADVMLATAAPVQIVNIRYTPKVEGVMRAELKLRTDMNGVIVTIPIEAEATK